MEWSSDFHHFSPLDESLYGLLSPVAAPVEMLRPHEWTREENKLFENALAEIDPTSPAFFENIAARVPWKSIEEIKVHYEALVHDLEMIESGNFPVPNYPPMNTVRKEKMGAKKKKDVGSPSKSNEAAPKTKTGQPRRRGVPWTEEEHQLFLMGLNKYGKGDWRSISRYYVITKTPTQVASHAQKYFRRQNSSTPAERRRPSIHDIHTVNPAVSAAYTPPVIPTFPTLHHSYSGHHVLEQNPPFMPIVNNPAFQAAPPAMFNMQANAYNMNPLPASCYFPSLRNQQYWE